MYSLQTNDCKTVYTKAIDKGYITHGVKDICKTSTVLILHRPFIWYFHYSRYSLVLSDVYPLLSELPRMQWRNTHGHAVDGKPLYAHEVIQHGHVILPSITDLIGADSSSRDGSAPPEPGRSAVHDTDL